MIKIITYLKENINSIKNIRMDGTISDIKNKTDDEIYRYIDNAKPFDKYGGYDIKDEYFDFEENYIGSYNNVAGFPLGLLIDILNDLEM